jgi:outer membrane protein OmpA-like peptidoglycan-associated protein
VSAKEPSLESLLRGSASENRIDRKALAGLLLEAARSIDRERAAQVAGVAPVDPRLRELRRVLVGAEIDQLARLSRQFDDPELFAEAVSRVLPSAVARAASRDEQLAQVLAPTVEQATQTSIRSDPRTLVNIMHPVILPAIRKSIIEIIDESFQSLNESLKHSFTLQGLKWRIEAWRSGKTFSEVVLKHTLVFQVEHVFLIHRTSGLLISHVTAERAASQDPQLVSSMLSAIQDFVRDSFSGGGGEGVDTMRLGELLLWSEPGPFASLVAVIRGNPPESLHNTLREVLTRIHAEHGRALEKFDGDSSPFLDVEAQLAELVRLRQEADQRGRPRFPWLLVPLVVALLFAGGWLLKQWRHEADLWEGYLQRLKAEPGIVVTKADRENGKWSVSGLRDPLAADPGQLLRDSGLDPERVVASWQPYQALNTPFVLKRLGGSLNPPPTVTLAVANDAIVATGSASSAWLQRARNLVAAMPLGSPVVDFSQVRDLNDGELGRLRAAIQSHSIHFNYNDALPAAGQDRVFDDLAAKLNELIELSSKLRVTSRVILTGHSDTTGQGTFNLSLSVARAEAVRAYLKKRGVDPALLSVRGAGPLEPLKEETSDNDRSVNRRVSFTVAIDE